MPPPSAADAAVLPDADEQLHAFAADEDTIYLDYDLPNPVSKRVKTSHVDESAEAPSDIGNEELETENVNPELPSVFAERLEEGELSPPLDRQLESPKFSLSQFNAYLGERRRKDGGPCTHTSLSGRPYSGSYTIENTKDFLKIYHSALRATASSWPQMMLTMTERHANQPFRLFGDIDAKPEQEQHLVKVFGISFLNQAKAFLTPAVRRQFPLLPAELEYRVSARKGGTNKLHFHFRWIIADPQSAKSIAESARKEWYQAYLERCVETGFEQEITADEFAKIIDTNVYNNGGLRMLGSCKKESPDSAYSMLDDEGVPIPGIPSFEDVEYASIRPNLDDPEEKMQYQRVLERMEKRAERAGNNHRRNNNENDRPANFGTVDPQTRDIIASYVRHVSDVNPSLPKQIHSALIGGSADFPCLFVKMRDRCDCPFIERPHQRNSVYLYYQIDPNGTALRCYDDDCSRERLTVPLTNEMAQAVNALGRMTQTPDTMLTGRQQTEPLGDSRGSPVPIIEEPDDGGSDANEREEYDQGREVLGHHDDSFTTDLPTSDANVLKAFVESKFTVDYEDGTSAAPVVKSVSYNPRFKSFTLKLYNRGVLCPFQESSYHDRETDWLYISISNAGARLRCFNKECKDAPSSSEKLTHEVSLLLSRKIASSASAGSSSDSSVVSARRESGDTVSNFNGIFAAPIPWQPLPTVSPDFAHLAHGHSLNYLSSFWASEGGYAVLPQEKDAKFVVAQCANGFRVFGIKLSGPIQHRQAPHVLAAIDPVSKIVQTALDWTGAGPDADRKVQVSGPDSEFARGMVLNVVNVTINNQFFVSKKEKTIVVAQHFENDITFFPDDEERNLAFQRSLSGSPGYLATYFNLHYGRVFRWSRNKWFVFSAHSGCWEEASDATLCKMLKDASFSNLYVEAYDRYQAASMGYALCLSISKVSAGLFGDFQKKILDQLKSVDGVEDQGFEEKLDSNLGLLAFDNGVLVLDRQSNTWTFREIRKEDYVSKKLNLVFGPRDQDAIQELLDQFFDPICCTALHGSESLRNYLLMMLSLTLDGNTRDQKFYVCYGPGGDGKTQVLKLLRASLEHRVTTQRPAFLTAVDRDANSATPALMDCLNRTAVLVDETDEKSGRRPAYAEGAIKALTSGGKVSGRALYKGQTTISIRFILIHLTNVLASVSALSGGMRRRLVCFPFGARFLASPDPDKPNEFPVDLAMDQKVETARWRLAFIYLLLDAWKRYNDCQNFHDLAKAPQPVKEATANFWDVMNDATQFLTERYDLGDPDLDKGKPMRLSKQVVRTSELLQDFNIWAKSTNRPELSETAFGVLMSAAMEGSGAFGEGRLKKLRVKFSKDDNVRCYYPLVPASDRTGDD